MHTFGGGVADSVVNSGERGGVSRTAPKQVQARVVAHGSTLATIAVKDGSKGS